MYFCTVNRNSRVMTCTLSSAHWQQASKSFQPCGALSRFGKIEINALINTIILMIINVKIIIIIIIYNKIKSCSRFNKRERLKALGSQQGGGGGGA